MEMQRYDCFASLVDEIEAIEEYGKTAVKNEVDPNIRLTQLTKKIGKFMKSVGEDDAELSFLLNHERADIRHWAANFLPQKHERKNEAWGILEELAAKERGRIGRRSHLLVTKVRESMRRQGLTD
ncbi:hypothetical protein [Pseudoroseicyclus tamaricis]|uniref:Uncharacterized protein n=1 Tax=Pseudoroseicyclus tamaricis TaxID=2705421 RepID=A0A6B2JME7_9RHOB|nr:hypothetical protein [Pseudoroseicyclus tamaricis]NDU99826.1 hypothetical protein [Pseudoroseicyclus tamaricis]